MPDALLEIKQNGVELYKHVFHPDIPTLTFVGLCNVAGSTFPVVEIQGRWVARVLAGSEKLPSREEMHAAIEHYRAHPSHRSSVPMQVQLLEYVEDVAGMLGMRPYIWRQPFTTSSISCITSTGNTERRKEYPMYTMSWPLNCTLC